MVQSDGAEIVAAPSVPIGSEVAQRGSTVEYRSKQAQNRRFSAQASQSMGSEGWGQDGSQPSKTVACRPGIGEKSRTAIGLTSSFVLTE